MRTYSRYSYQPLIRPHFRSLNIPQQLQALGLPAFQGRLHSGIDVSYLTFSRNSAWLTFLFLSTPPFLLTGHTERRSRDD
jgi:hypothetical protein